MSPRPARLRLAALLGSTLLGLTFMACGGAPEEKVETTDQVPVAVVEAHAGSIRAAVTATGEVRPAPGADLLVVAPQPARVALLPKAQGDTIAKGELLVRFDIPALAAEAEARRSDVERARARLATARSAATRLQGLFERGVAARREVEEAERERTDAEAGLAEAESARVAAGELAGRAEVRAPFAGVVAARWHNPGDLVDAAASDPVLRLIDPARLEAAVAVPVDELPRILEGGAARVVGPPAYPPAEATVVSRPVAVDPATGAATVRLAFEQPCSLPAGTPVSAEIFGPERSGAVLVPADALVAEGAERFLFVVDASSVAHRRPVEVGVVAGGEAEVLSGVAAGDRVVVRGQAALPDGATVRVEP